jgi:hypothetical protein
MRGLIEWTMTLMAMQARLCASKHQVLSEFPPPQNGVNLVLEISVPITVSIVVRRCVASMVIIFIIHS